VNEGYKMKAVINAWNHGLDYIEHDGKLYGMFLDGIWLMKGEHIDMNQDKRNWITMPETAWGSES